VVYHISSRLAFQPKARSVGCAPARVFVRPTDKDAEEGPPGHSPIGRILTPPAQRQPITPGCRKCAPWTRRLPSRSPTISPRKALTQDERLECWVAYFNWTANSKKPQEPPIPDLKQKHPSVIGLLLHGRARGPPPRVQPKGARPDHRGVRQRAARAVARRKCRIYTETHGNGGAYDGPRPQVDPAVQAGARHRHR